VLAPSLLTKADGRQFPHRVIDRTGPFFHVSRVIPPSEAPQASTAEAGSIGGLAYATAAARGLAYPLFFASGLAGLAQEVVWTRLLLYVFGSGLYAVTAVLAAFMAGLALGAAVLGRWADRSPSPLRFYAALEGLIGLAGLAMPSALGQIHRIDGWVYAQVGDNFAALTFARFVLGFGLLLLPTTLMGATLPALSRFLVRRREHLGLHVSELYGVNTVGAVAGAFLAGFVLIAEWGVRQTAWAAAGLNLLVAVAAWGLSRRIEGLPAGGPGLAAGLAPGSGSPPTAEAVARARWVYGAAGLTGLVALAAQVLWFRSLVFVFVDLKNTTYAFSSMLTVYLAGLGLGSLIVGALIDRHPDPMRLYGLLVTLTGAAIAFSVTVAHAGATAFLLGDALEPARQRLNWPMAVTNTLLQAFSVLGPPTLLMGMALPAAARAVVSVERVGGEVGRLYAINTAGAIVGSVLAGFVLIPVLGLTGGLFALAIADVGIGLALLWRSGAGRAYALAFAAATVGLMSLAWGGLPRERALQRLQPGETLVHYNEGPLATVSVVQGRLGFRTLHIDGAGVAGTDPILQTDQKSLAHVPMLLAADPRRALTVGFGSGGASYSYLLHNRLERLDCVEIAGEVLSAAPGLAAANHGVLERRDPRYRIIFDDARAWLRVAPEPYDIIATDCTDLRYKSNANLYDLEYFQFCRRALAPGGLVVVWMPLAGLSESMFRLALRTFHRVFPEMAIFYMNNVPTHYLLLIGWREKLELDALRLKERLGEPDVAADLAELDLNDPVKLLSTFVTAGSPLADYLAGDGVNTENRPWLEFQSPKEGFDEQPLLNNLASLMAARVSPRSWIVPGTLEAAEAERLARYEAAFEHVLAGHAAYRRLEIEASVPHYLAAARLAPEDRTVQSLLSYPELTILAGRGDLWARLMLGRTTELQGAREAAARHYRATLEAIGRREPAQAARDQWLADRAARWLKELNEGEN